MNSPLTIIIPCYNEAGNISVLYNRLESTLAAVTDYEVLFIDDGSSDGTAELLKKLKEQDERVSFIRF